MNDLRKAAEMALDALEDIFGKEKKDVGAINALRQALDLQTAIDKGTKAWADVPNASDWVDELRGNDRPPVKSYAGGKPNYCTPEVTPDVDAVNMTQERVDEMAKGEHEPVAWINYNAATGEETINRDCHSELASTPLYKTPKREWVGLTDDEILNAADVFGSFQYGDSQGHKRLEFAKAIEAKLKEKNT